ncbi:DUF2637 domain-containing protein [Pseudarthrobacter sp. MDT3-26]|uniref:DUF2637 domain-containing protein n=1 Tax=Pseudarthrobacter raffinosi TaxID=2953651 RepID=UPI00208ED07A|nr:DUF2637 domain-containing protein [Pseudarthrobacter sp. MDT3-26]MCO4263774.1 DUF2637 domain-containing protein [Pseudarthrobacter sp. MDT3-26]
MTHPKAARISPDSRPIAYGAAALASAIYLGAFATSFFGQASLAKFMLIPEQLQYVAPAVIDLALILFTMATLVRRSRGESTLITNLMTSFWTTVSITANIVHVLIPAGPQSSWSAGTYAGAALSALMPLAALGASLVIENVLIARPEPEAVAGPAVAAKPVRPPSPALAQPKPKAAALTSAPSPANDASPVVEPVAEATAPVQAPGPPVVAAPLPASHTPQVRRFVDASKVDWEVLTRAERWDLVQSMKEKDHTLSNPVIAEHLGVSLSTIKRLKPEEQEFEPA